MMLRIQLAVGVSLSLVVVCALAAACNVNEVPPAASDGGAADAGDVGADGADASAVLDSAADAPPILDAGADVVDDGAAKIVFITSAEFSGALGGLTGADSKCQQLATDAGLPGQYKAWLSTDTQDPDNRFTHPNVPYVMTNGTKVADSYADLIAGVLDSGPYLILAPINITEDKGTQTPTGVWTGTLPNGTSIVGMGQNCSGWTSSSDAGTGATGDDIWQDAHWSAGGNLPCSNLYPLFCFEQ